MIGHQCFDTERRAGFLNEFDFGRRIG